jgi:hypothetical protein
MNKTNKQSSKIVEFLKEKKNRSRVYLVFWILVLVVLTVVNNLRTEPEVGPYPPDFYQKKEVSNQKITPFKLMSFDNRLYSLESHKDQIVILSFIEVLKKDGIKQLDALKKLKENVKDKKYSIFAIAIDDMFNNGALLNKTDIYKNYPFPILFAEKDIMANYNLQSITPISFILNKDLKLYNVLRAYNPELIFQRDIDLLSK